MMQTCHDSVSIIKYVGKAKNSISRSKNIFFSSYKTLVELRVAS